MESPEDCGAGRADPAALGVLDSFDPKMLTLLPP
jgi:hypothetical protein